MFVAKFNTAKNEPFKMDKNQNFPLVGTVLAGTARAAIMNGTMFQRENLKENTTYLCDNVVEEYEGKPQVRTIVIGEVSTVDFLQLRTQLGVGRLLKTADETVAAETTGAKAE